MPERERAIFSAAAFAEFAEFAEFVRPQDAADFRILGEAEGIIQKFVSAWEVGERSGVFEAERFQVDVTKSPLPRFDLLKFDQYLYVGIQHSRGCPFTCEFCGSWKPRAGKAASGSRRAITFASVLRFLQTALQSISRKHRRASLDKSILSANQYG